MKKKFISGAKFYNHLRGSTDRLFWVQSGRLIASDFTGTTSPMVVDSVSENGAVVTSMFWQTPQHINFSELTFI